MTREVYDKLCKVLTDYENPSDIENYDDIDWEMEFYEMLVEIQNDSEFA